MIGFILTLAFIVISVTYECFNKDLNLNLIKSWDNTVKFDFVGIFATFPNAM